MTWKKTFWTITSGQFVSQIGSSAVSFALMWWIASSTGSAAMLGLAGLIGFLPTALLGAFAGVVADRYNRKLVCIAADMTVGIVSAVYALLLFLFNLPPWTVFVVLLARGATVTFQQPAYMALTPQYVPVEDLLKANGLGQLVASASYILGPVLGAALFATFSLPVVLVSDLVGAIFAVSCGLMGASGMVQGIPLSTYMQSAIAPDLMGRAFSLIQMSAAFATPVGLVIGAPLAELLGVSVWFLVAGIFITLSAIIGIVGNHRLEKAASACTI